MKLTTHTQVSVDGVMQANGGRNEELDPGMERGGWARPLFDDQAMAYVQDVYQRADVFLVRPADLRALRRLLGDTFGRPDLGCVERATEARGIDHAHRSAMGGHDRPLRDVAAAVGELKAKPEGEL
jgi:hypothetical protein